MQSLADQFNVVTVTIFGVAGHGKGLIDAMSSFGVKSILRRNIITLTSGSLTAKTYVNILLSEVISHVTCPFTCGKFR